MEKECELYGAVNKISKLEQVLEMKQRQIEELEKLLHSHEEVTDRSLIMESNFLGGRSENNEDIKRLVDEIGRFEEEVEKLQNQVLASSGQKDLLQAKIIEL